MDENGFVFMGVRIMPVEYALPEGTIMCVPNELFVEYLAKRLDKGIEAVDKFLVENADKCVVIKNLGDDNM